MKTKMYYCTNAKMENNEFKQLVLKAAHVIISMT